MELDTDDAFAELGLRPDATQAQVKAAWRRLVSEWHPDRNNSAAAVARMQRINLAFKAIRRGVFAADSSPADTQPSAAAADGAETSTHRQDGTDRSKDSDPAQGAGADQAEQQSASADESCGRPERSIQRKVRLTLEEAASGCTKVLRGRITEDCSACDGAGYQVLGGHCPKCHGSGAIRQASWFGWVSTSSECDACHGGGIARQECPTCDGSGKAAPIEYRVPVRFPAGVRDGDQLLVDSRRLKQAAAPGDLNIRVEVLPHEFLRLDDDGTIRCEMPVDGFSWIANRSVDVPTLQGLRSVRLDRDRLVYRLSGLGFPVERRGAAGDQLVSITPVFPNVLSSDQEVLIDQLIATAAKPDEKAADGRLQRWNEKMRAWKRSRR